MYLYKFFYSPGPCAYIVIKAFWTLLQPFLSTNILSSIQKNKKLSFSLILFSINPNITYFPPSHELSKYYYKCKVSTNSFHSLEKACHLLTWVARN